MASTSNVYMIILYNTPTTVIIFIYNGNNLYKKFIGGINYRYAKNGILNSPLKKN